MNQILNVFRKDTRRFWPEIAVVLALTVAIMAMAPYEWRGNPYYGDYSLQLLRELTVLLSPLLVIGWVLLIARVVHAEPLVGDRQFWITRPYEWKKLLAAKVLFVAAYVIVPLLLMQCVLLARAGFTPAHWIPGLLWNLLPVAAMILLPLMAVAAVTSGFGRMVLILIGVLLVALVATVGMALVAQRDPVNMGASRPIGTLAMWALLLVMCAAVVMVQYSARKTRTALLLLGGMIVGLIAVSLLGPDQRLIDRMYPQGNGPAPAVLTPVPLVRGVETTWPGSDMVGQDVWLAVSGVADGYKPLFDEVKFTMEGANGARWESGWQHLLYPTDSGAVASIAGGIAASAGGGGGKSGPGENDAEKKLGVRIMMPRAVYEEVKESPVALHMTLAVTEAKIASVTDVSDTEGEFAVPGVGYCETGGWPNATKQSNAGYLACRSALHVPLSSMRVRVSYLPCPADQSGHNTEETRTIWSNWEGSTDAMPTDLFLVPVANRNEMIESGFPDENGVALCPERATLTFTRYQPVRRTQIGVTIPDYRLKLGGADEQ